MAQRIVRVIYANQGWDPSRIDPNDLTQGYAHTWDLEEEPHLGQHVVVEHTRGQRAIIIGYDTTHPGPLEPIHHTLTRQVA